MRTLLFAGPTVHGLDLAPWSGLGLERHGPVRHGDLFGAGLAAGDTVLIVDGVYQHYAPIRFKEIMAMLRDGVRVYGAASMGALRAAELAPLGMIGVGQVYEWYAGGAVDADADVALSHAEADDGYRPFTVPLVSVRHAARCTPGLPDDQQDAVIRHAATLPFSRRSPRALAVTSEHDPQLNAAVRAVCAHLAAAPEHDVKRRDLLELLDLVAADTDAPAADAPAAAPDWPVSAWEQQYRLDHTPTSGGGPARGDVLRFCQLFLPDWRKRHRAWVLEQVREGDPSRTLDGIVRDRGLWPDDPAARRELETALALTAEPAASRRDSMLVRTFRAGPGKFVYRDVPASSLSADELVEVTALAAQALGATALAEERHAHFSHAQLAASEVIDVLTALWDEPWTQWSWIDRGFTGEDEVLRAARRFFVAARSIVAGRNADALVGAR